MKSTGKTNLGRLLRAHRLLTESDMRSLAAAIGISPATICRLEMGHQPDGATFVKLLTWMMKKEPRA